jgi:hypothetical protein
MYSSHSVCVYALYDQVLVVAAFDVVRCLLTPVGPIRGSCYMHYTLRATTADSRDDLAERS